MADRPLKPQPGWVVVLRNSHLSEFDPEVERVCGDEKEAFDWIAQQHPPCDEDDRGSEVGTMCKTITCHEMPFGHHLYRYRGFEISAAELYSVQTTSPVLTWVRAIEDSFDDCCEHFVDRFMKVS